MTTTRFVAVVVVESDDPRLQDVRTAVQWYAASEAIVGEAEPVALLAAMSVDDGCAMLAAWKHAKGTLGDPVTEAPPNAGSLRRH